MSISNIYLHLYPTLCEHSSYSFLQQASAPLLNCIFALPVCQAEPRVVALKFLLSLLLFLNCKKMLNRVAWVHYKFTISTLKGLPTSPTTVLHLWTAFPLSAVPSPTLCPVTKPQPSSFTLTLKRRP